MLHRVPCYVNTVLTVNVFGPSLKATCNKTSIAHLHVAHVRLWYKGFSYCELLPPNTFAVKTKEAWIWVEWIPLKILAIEYRSVTQVEKVMFMCSIHHMMCFFNCIGRTVGILRYSLRARSNKTAAASFTQACFWHSENPISKGQNISWTSSFFLK